MAGITMNKFALLPALVALALVSACNPAPIAKGEPPLAGARLGAPLNLVNQDGQRVTDADFAGKYRLVYFGYTYCPDVCPVDMQHLLNGYQQFAKAHPELGAKVQPIFITVDPARDTPDKVKAFIRQFDDKMVGLTGSEEEIAAAAKGYAVVYNKVEGSAPDAYLMSHTQLAYLMGPDGKPIALVPTDAINTPENEGDPAKVKALLEQWVV